MKKYSIKFIALKLSVVFLILTSAFFVLGASGDVDEGFNPQLTVDVSNQGGNLIMQPDGKIIIFGGNTPSGGSSTRPFVKRLNPDGSTDATFDCQECRTFVADVVTLQSDGKLLVGGADKVIRINRNGSTDTSFTAPFNAAAYPCKPQFITSQPDGKALVTCAAIGSEGYITSEFVTRLNSNGTTDPTFTRIIPPPNQFTSVIFKVVALPDGKILVGGGQNGDSRGWLNRYNSDGSPDGSFQGSNVYSNGRIVQIEVQPDGKYLIGGWYKIYRLNSDGSTDTSYSQISTPQNQYRLEIKFLSDGRIYTKIGTTYPFPQPNGNFFVRNTATGGQDGTFNPAIDNPGYWTVDSLGRIIVSKGGFKRLNLDGSIDTSFNPNLSSDGYVNAVAVQSSGKMIVVGEFSKANGFNSGRITRINQDGTSDTSFNTGTGFDVAPKDVAVQADGKILVSGLFTSYNGAARSFVARLNADGSLDAAFNPTITFDTAVVKEVSRIVYLPNGKIMIGGNFATVNGASRKMLAILNGDGSLDTTFNPTFNSDNYSTITKISVQTNGQIMVAGYFGMKRFNGDGTLDSSFNYVTEPYANVTDFYQGPDGRYIASSNPGNTLEYPYVRLLNNDGTIDYSLNVSAGGQSAARINSVYRQPGGNVIFGGRFSTVRGLGRVSNNVARVTAFGGADIYFPKYGTNGTVNSIFGQPDDKVIFIGEFNRIENVGRSGIARLTLSPKLTGTQFDFDGDGRSDISVFRPSTSVWYSLLTGGSSGGIQSFGAAGDMPVPADYDGDGKTDLGVFRPSTGDWFYILSQTNTLVQYNYGLSGDVPLPAIGNDRRARPAVFRPSNNTWYGVGAGVFGAAGDKPLIGDFDGDGNTDAAIYRPSTGVWWYMASSASYQQRATQWGIAEDIPAPGDYDGDGKTDYAVFRPSNGGWYIAKSTGGYTILQFGLSEDKPVPADYDGDGKTDIAVFRPSTGAWYLLQSTSGYSGAQWGISTDIPVQNAFIH